MNCPNCGNPVEKDAPYCLKCFAPVQPRSFWQKLLGAFQRPAPSPRRIVNIKKIVNIKTTDPDGQHHEYHSLKEVPPELRSEIEKAAAEALTENPGVSSADGLKTTLVSDKTISVFKVKDPSGNERTYHSLDELPPDIRAALENARKKTNH
jgi:hypothetical protein